MSTLQQDSNIQVGQSTKRRQWKRFAIHLVHHCNCNCKGCSHFSPLCSEEYLDIVDFEKDIKRLSELTNKSLERINLLGGEPLLHENIHKFFDIVRSYFPQTNLECVTNGLILHKQPNTFWETCRKNNIMVIVSQYPVSIKKMTIDAFSKQFGVKVKYRDKIEKGRWRKIKMDISKHKDMNENFYKCTLADPTNHCVCFEDGKLYTCCTIAYIKFFNKYFGVNFEVSEDDYIDIHKVKNINEIIDYLNKPVPFCGYCDFTEHHLGEWEISKKEISEWT